MSSDPMMNGDPLALLCLALVACVLINGFAIRRLARRQANLQALLVHLIGLKSLRIRSIPPSREESESHELN